MDKKRIIEILAANKQAIQQRGASHIALFGSMARGEANPGDIDLMVELDPETPLGVFEYVELIQFIGDLFPQPVDVANKDRLKPYVRPSAERDAIYAF